MGSCITVSLYIYIYIYGTLHNERNNRDCFGILVPLRHTYVDCATQRSVVTHWLIFIPRVNLREHGVLSSKPPGIVRVQHAPNMLANKLTISIYSIVTERVTLFPISLPEVSPVSRNYRVYFRAFPIYFRTARCMMRCILNLLFISFFLSILVDWCFSLLNLSLY